MSISLQGIPGSWGWKGRVKDTIEVSMMFLVLRMILGRLSTAFAPMREIAGEIPTRESDMEIPRNRSSFDGSIDELYDAALRSFFIPVRSVALSDRSRRPPRGSREGFEASLECNPSLQLEEGFEASMTRIFEVESLPHRPF